MKDERGRYVGRTLAIVIAGIFIFTSFGSTVGHGDVVSEGLNSEPSGPDIHQASPSDQEPLASGKVCVLVEPAKYSPLLGELLTYKADLESEGYTVEIRNDAWADHLAIRAFLKIQWQSNGLVGCVIVGNLPYAWYEIFNDFDELGVNSLFPIDLFYTDLDATWVDNNPADGIYDDHIDTGPGDLEPEIWLGRITMESNWEDEVDLISNYFFKVHEYRMGNLSLPHRALHYVDDDWVPWTEEYGDPIKAVYPDLRTVNDVYVTTAADYAVRIQEGYEWIQIHCHANHSPMQHAFLLDDDIKGSGGNFRSENLSQDGQKSLFTNIFTCGAANYSNADYLCGWYIFTQTYGLCSVGSTKPGSMLNFGDFYDPLATGNSIGAAFKNWFSNTAEDLWGLTYQDYARSWFYGMTIIGDPTLSPLLADTNPPASVTGLDLSLDGTDILLNWTAPVTHDVNHYLIYRAASADGFNFGTPYHDTGADSDPLSLTWADAGAGTGDGQYYYYIVRAVDNDGNVEVNEEAVGLWVKSLPAGWNLISLPLIQSDMGIDSVLASVAGDWDRIYIYDPQSPNPWLSTATYRPENLNNINLLDHTMGIWIHVLNATSLAVRGTEAVTTNILLHAGWNLVGYPTLASDKTVAEVFGGTGYDRVEGFAAASPYIQVLDGSYVMTPGEGYWVRVPADTVWNVGA